MSERKRSRRDEKEDPLTRYLELAAAHKYVKKKSCSQPGYDKETGCSADGYLMQKRAGPPLVPVEVQTYSDFPPGLRVQQYISAASPPQPVVLHDVRSCPSSLKRAYLDSIPPAGSRRGCVSSVCIDVDGSCSGIKLDSFGAELTEYTDYVVFLSVDNPPLDLKMTSFACLKVVDRAFADKKGMPLPSEREGRYLYVTLVCSKKKGTFRLMSDIIDSSARKLECGRVVLSSMEDVIGLYARFGYIPMKNAPEDQDRPEADGLTALLGAVLHQAKSARQRT